MTLADIVGFVGYVPLMLGTFWLTTRFKKSAWSTRIVGDILLAIAGVLGGLASVVLISLSFAAMDIYGLWKARPNTPRDNFYHDSGLGFQPSKVGRYPDGDLTMCECGRCPRG